MYLAGPMVGLPEHNYPAFRAAVQLLREQGHEVVSPHELEISRGKPWTHYFRKDLLAMIARCNAMVLLPGWTESRGAMIEYSIAAALEFTIYELVEGELRVFHGY